MSRHSVPLSASMATPSSGSMPAVHDERTLVRRVQEGDVAAFEKLFRQHYDGLVAFAQMLGLALGESEEVVQDVLMGVWMGRAAWEVRATVASYLYGAVRNRVIGVAQHARVVQRWMEREQAQPDESLSAWHAASVERGDEELERQELTRVVRAAIAGLPERCRTTYLLSREQGLTYTEIAQAMGTSVKTVNHQMTRAIAALRRAIAAWRGDSDS